MKDEEKIEFMLDCLKVCVLFNKENHNVKLNSIDKDFIEKWFETIIREKQKNDTNRTPKYRMDNGKGGKYAIY